jgi:hypothetical protein
MKQLIHQSVAVGAFITLFCGCQPEHPKDASGSFTWYSGGAGKDGTNASPTPVVAKKNATGGYDWYLGSSSTNVSATNSVSK